MHFVDPINGSALPVTAVVPPLSRIAPALQGLQHPLYAVAWRLGFQKSVVVIEITRGIPLPPHGDGDDLAFRYLSFHPDRNHVRPQCTLQELEQCGLKGLSFVYAMVGPGLLVPVGMPWSVILERLFDPTGPQLTTIDAVVIQFNFIKNRFQMQRPPPLPTFYSGAHMMDERIRPILQLDNDCIVLRFSLEFGEICASMSRLVSDSCISSEECTMGRMDAHEISRLESTLYNFSRPIICSRHVFPTIYLLL